MQQRRIVWFSGTVQGVGFRYTALSLARRFQVTGYVRNAPDGRVEMVIESQEHQADRFIQAVQDQMGSYISSTQQQMLPASGEFSDFSMRP